MIGRERAANQQFVHRGEADAIGERPCLVRMLAKQGASGVKPVGIRFFPLDRDKPL
jgi:hypothetical protein